MTEETATVLMHAGVECTCRGPIAVKGKGTLTTYFVTTPQEGGSLTDPKGLKRGNSCYAFKSEDQGALLRNPVDAAQTDKGAADKDASINKLLEVPTIDVKPQSANGHDKVTCSATTVSEISPFDSKINPPISINNEILNCEMAVISDPLNGHEHISSANIANNISGARCVDEHLVGADESGSKDKNIHYLPDKSNPSIISIESDSRSIILPIGSNLDVRVPLFHDSTDNDNHTSKQQSIVIVNNMYSKPITSVSMTTTNVSPNISIINIHPILPTLKTNVTCSSSCPTSTPVSWSANRRASEVQTILGSPVNVSQNYSAAANDPSYENIKCPKCSIDVPEIDSNESQNYAKTYSVFSSNNGRSTVPAINSFSTQENGNIKKDISATNLIFSNIFPHTTKIQQPTRNMEITSCATSTTTNSTTPSIFTEPQPVISSLLNELDSTSNLMYNSSTYSTDFVSGINSCCIDVEEQPSSIKTKYFVSDVIIDDSNSKLEPDLMPLKYFITNHNPSECSTEMELMKKSISSTVEINPPTDLETASLMWKSCPEYSHDNTSLQRQCMFLPFHLPSPTEFDTYIPVTSPIFSYSTIPSPIFPPSPPTCFSVYPSVTSCSPPGTPLEIIEGKFMSTAIEINAVNSPIAMKPNLQDVIECVEELSPPETETEENKSKTPINGKTSPKSHSTCPYLKSFKEERERMKLGRGSFADEHYLPFNINDLPKRNRSMSVQEGKHSLLRMKKFQSPIYSRLKEKTRKKFLKAFSVSSKSVDKIAPPVNVYDDLFVSDSTDSGSESGTTDELESSATNEQTLLKTETVIQIVGNEKHNRTPPSLSINSDVLIENDPVSINCKNKDGPRRKRLPDLAPLKLNPESRSADSIFAMLSTGVKDDVQTLDRKLHVIPNKTHQRKRNQVFV